MQQITPAELVIQEVQRWLERQAALARAYRDAFDFAIAASAPSEIAPEARLVVGQLVQLVVDARRAVHRSGPYDSNYEVSGREGPARISKVLGQLHRAAMICYGGDADSATRLVVRIGLDSMLGKRRLALCELAENQSGVTAEVVAETLECDTNTAWRVLDDLVALDLAKRCKPANRVFYQPSSKLLEAAALISLDEFEADEALRKLFDLPIDSNPAREREKVGV